MLSQRLLSCNALNMVNTERLITALMCRALSTSPSLQKKIKKIPPKNFPDVYLKGTAEFVRRQLSDPYVKKRRLENYRCRSAFKLIQILEKHDFLKEGSVVIDLGASPGSWSQVVREHMGSNSGLIVAVDLVHFPTMEGVHFIKGDFTDSSVQKEIKNIIKEQSASDCADAVLCDAAPKSSGIKAFDQDAIVILASSAVSVALRHLKKGGSLLFKLFSGENSGSLVRSIRHYFDQVKCVKPDASRKESSEYYVLCLGFKPSLARVFSRRLQRVCNSMLRLGLNVGRHALKTLEWRSFHASAFRKTVEETQSKSTTENDDTSAEERKKTQGLTPDNPFTVASPTSKCIVGCSCEPESLAIHWFYVTEGEPQTCNCGYFFKLDKVDPTTTWIPEYSRIMFVDETRVDPRLVKQEGVLAKMFAKRKRKAIPPASMERNINETKVDS